MPDLPAPHDAPRVGSLRRLGLPVLLGLAIVLPFIVLEVVNRTTFAFPFVLFGVMWLLAAGFFAGLFVLVREVRAGGARPAVLLLRATVLIPVVWFWIGLVLDQMPCFLGVPNCD